MSLWKEEGRGLQFKLVGGARSCFRGGGAASEGKELLQRGRASDGVQKGVLQLEAFCFVSSWLLNLPPAFGISVLSSFGGGGGGGGASLPQDMCVLSWSALTTSLCSFCHALYEAVEQSNDAIQITGENSTILVHILSVRVIRVCFVLLYACDVCAFVSVLYVHVCCISMHACIMHALICLCCVWHILCMFVYVCVPVFACTQIMCL